jgi:hypothetical protein
MYIYIYIYVCVYAHITDTRVHSAHTHTHTFSLSSTHTHTHTHSPDFRFELLPEPASQAPHSVCQKRVSARSECDFAGHHTQRLCVCVCVFTHLYTHTLTHTYTGVHISAHMITLITPHTHHYHERRVHIHYIPSVCTAAGSRAQDRTLPASQR